MLRISEICKEKGGLKQTLAKKLDTTYKLLHSTITRNPQLETLRTIANTLNLLIAEELFEKPFDLKYARLSVLGTICRLSTVRMI